MSNQNEILKNYNGSSPIFPLPDFVLFPKTGHQFRIFEPRYKDMIKDALDSQRLITMALLKPGWEDDYEGDPPIYNVGTLSYLFKSKDLDNGEYNIMLMGLEKVIINEATKIHSYRRGAMTVIQDNVSWSSELEDRDRLVGLFSEFLELSKSNPKDNLFDNPAINTQMLTNLICSIIPIPIPEQQKLLELPDTGLRLDILIQYIQSLIETETQIDELKDILPLPEDWN